MSRILLNYQRLHQLISIAAMINRWAPPLENETTKYAAFVASRVDVDMDEVINFNRAEIAVPMLKAMIRFENGIQPYDFEQISDGYQLALTTD